MIDIIAILLLAGLGLFLIARARKLRNTPESKLSIFEHPATFEKPPIETVSASLKQGPGVHASDVPEMEANNDQREVEL